MFSTQSENSKTHSRAPVVLITGAAVRIGAAMTRRFHQGGYRVVIHYNRSFKQAEALATELNELASNSARVLKADLADTGEVTNLAHNTLAQWGRLDVLINNASAFYPVPLQRLREEDWINLMHSNARAPLFLCRELASALQESKGCILNIVDSTAMQGLGHYTPYTMAKAALANMTRSLAKELAPDIRVNGISPGAILWPEATGEMSEAEKTTILERTAVKRKGCIDDVANLAFFLVEKATYVTGQIIRVDGGAALFG